MLCLIMQSLKSNTWHKIDGKIIASKHLKFYKKKKKN